MRARLPVDAIFYEDDVPDQWASYYDINVEFFNKLSAPGGAAKIEYLPYNHPAVAALPLQGNH